MEQQNPNRLEQIHNKGFDFYRSSSLRDPAQPVDYRSIQVGVKTLPDATLNLESTKPKYRRYYSKEYVMECLATRNLDALREISDFFYRTNGIYQRVCSYFATMYRYDWYIVPEIYTEKYNTNKIKEDFYSALKYLDDSYVKKISGEIALAVIKHGCYYGYVCEGEMGFSLQELPIKYCRTRFFTGPLPAVEFDLSYFDTTFPNAAYRLRVLKMFPPEFQKGYKLWKSGKLVLDPGDTRPWYLLDQGAVCKFDMGIGNGDMPLFAAAIPELLDLDAAQDLDRRKQLQKLLKIIVQKLPRDKNGDLIFDVDEAKDIHNNAVQMLRKAIGVDVLTTFADIQAIDVADDNTSSSTDDLERVERSVYNAFGAPNSIFNSDSNVGLSSSILNDEAFIKTLLLQIGVFWDRMLRKRMAKVSKGGNNGKKYNFRLFMIETTQYNYQAISKMYKEQTQIGFSKCLPQIALGISQSAIVHTITFENEILNLPAIMIPPLMSSTMNIETIKEVGSKGTKLEEGEVGRPEKEDSEKSDKTLANRESLGME